MRWCAVAPLGFVRPFIPKRPGFGSAISKRTVSAAVVAVDVELSGFSGSEVSHGEVQGTAEGA